MPITRVPLYVARRAPSAGVDDDVATSFVVAQKKFAIVDSPSLRWLFRIASYELANHRRTLLRYLLLVREGSFLLRPVGRLTRNELLLRRHGLISEADRTMSAVAEWLVVRPTASTERDPIAKLVSLAVGARNRYPSANPNRSGHSLRRVVYETN